MTRHATIAGVAPAAPLSAPGPASRSSNPDGRYRWRPEPNAMETPVAELNLTTIRVGLDCAHTDASNALRDKRYDDAVKYINDAKLLGRALRRFEIQQERARLAGVK